MEFIESASVEDALKKYRKEKPYFVLLDIILPGKSGKEFLREVLEFDPDAGVFVMSVLSREQDMKDCLKLGASAYLTKPLTEDKLEHIMHTLKHLDG
ncbi:MAG: response regulator [Candidatus Altiarchaeota archaeon]|nr:response regulator [Candidatus Altiarchaeota archaeon]